MCEVLRYAIEHEDGLLELWKGEPDWDDCTAPDFIETFRQSLLDSEKFVCTHGRE